MNQNIPAYLSVLLIIVTVFILSFTLFVIYRSLKIYDISPFKRNIYITISVIIGAGWLVITSIIVFNGTLLDFTTTPPKIITVIIPAIVGVSYICSSERVNNLLKVTPAAWLIYIQSFRIIIEFILWQLHAIGIIPYQMSFTGYNYDVLIGLSAPLIAYYSFTDVKWPKIIPLLWNSTGLLLVMNITLISFLSTPSPMRVFFNEPANTLPAYFPFIWLPVFIVPFAVTIHILSIKQIMRYY